MYNKFYQTVLAIILYLSVCTGWASSDEDRTSGSWLYQTASMTNYMSTIQWRGATNHELNEGFYLMGYISSIMEVGIYGKNVCPLYSVTKYEEIKVILAYLDRDPKRMEWPASYIVLKAFTETWPCKK